MGSDDLPIHPPSYSSEPSTSSTCYHVQLFSLCVTTDVALCSLTGGINEFCAIRDSKTQVQYSPGLKGTSRGPSNGKVMVDMKDFPCRQGSLASEALGTWLCCLKHCYCTLKIYSGRQRGIFAAKVVTDNEIVSQASKISIKWLSAPPYLSSPIPKARKITQSSIHDKY